MEGVSVFGQRSSPSIASQIMGSPSLHQTPSPSQPERAPSGILGNLYAQLYAIASKASMEEEDAGRRIELERIVTFADSSLNEVVQVTGSAGAPVPNLPVAPPAPAVAGPPGLPAMPPAATPPPNPGGVGVPSPGAA